MNFKSTNLALFIALFITGLLHYLFTISGWWFIIPIALYVSFLAYGAASIHSDFFIKAFCYSNTIKKEIAITFDDGPTYEFTPKVVAVLAEYDAKATFFVIGKNCRDNETILKKMDAEGHTIGNHTYSHSFFIDFKSKEEFKKELKKTSDFVYQTISKRMKLFRPPYGVTTPHLAKASREAGYAVIGWNIRSMDTTNANEEKIVKTVLKGLKPGAVVLFHDTSEKTINVLRQTLQFAKQNGFKIVSLQTLLNIEPYE